MNHKNNLYLVEYEDAAFSYKNFSSASLKKLNNTKSVGQILGKTKEYTDLGLIATKKDGSIATTKGVLIPNKSIVKITKLYEKRI